MFTQALPLVFPVSQIPGLAASSLPGYQLVYEMLVCVGSRNKKSEYKRGQMGYQRVPVRDQHHDSLVRGPILQDRGRLPGCILLARVPCKIPRIPDNVSASAISASTNNSTIGQAKTSHTALQVASCFWKQNVSVCNWKCNLPDAFFGEHSGHIIL